VEKKEDLILLLDLYKILKENESEFNLYKESKTLDKLIEKVEKELEELKNDKWWRKKS